MSIEALLDAAAQLEAPEFERFISELLAMRARRIAPSLSKDEAALLQQINKRLPPDIQQRYDALIEKRELETLTPEEYQELISLNDQIEMANAERIKAIGELAQLRNVSFTDLMNELGIHPTPYA